MNAALDLSRSIMIRNIWYVSAFGALLEVIPNIWVGFAEHIFFHPKFLAFIIRLWQWGAIICVIVQPSEIMLHKIYSSCMTCPAQAFGDILEDPTELIRQKNRIHLQPWWWKIS